MKGKFAARLNRIPFLSEFGLHMITVFVSDRALHIITVFVSDRALHIITVCYCSVYTG